MQQSLGPLIIHWLATNANKHAPKVLCLQSGPVKTVCLCVCTPLSLCMRVFECIQGPCTLNCRLFGCCIWKLPNCAMRSSRPLPDAGKHAINFRILLAGHQRALNGLHFAHIWQPNPPHAGPRPRPRTTVTVNAVSAAPKQRGQDNFSALCTNALATLNKLLRTEFSRNLKI